ARAVDAFGEVVRRFGVEGDSCLLGGHGSLVGLSRHEVERRVADADLLLDVMGYLRDEPDLLAAARRRVFLDIDPGFGQMWRELGLADVFAGHDVFVTVGERIGRPDCAIPTCGIDWITTPQPVVLEEWPAAPGGERITTVAAWRGAYAPV